MYLMFELSMLKKLGRIPCADGSAELSALVDCHMDLGAGRLYHYESAVSGD